MISVGVVTWVRCNLLYTVFIKIVFFDVDGSEFADAADTVLTQLFWKRWAWYLAPIAYGVVVMLRWIGVAHAVPLYAVRHADV